MGRFKIELEFSVESDQDARALFEQLRIDFENSQAYQDSKYNTAGSYIKLYPTEPTDPVVV